MDILVIPRHPECRTQFTFDRRFVGYLNSLNMATRYKAAYNQHLPQFNCSEAEHNR